jgi:hypothetical protein
MFCKKAEIYEMPIFHQGGCGMSDTTIELYYKHKPTRPSDTPPRGEFIGTYCTDAVHRVSKKGEIYKKEKGLVATPLRCNSITVCEPLL